MKHIALFFFVLFLNTRLTAAQEKWPNPKSGRLIHQAGLYIGGHYNTKSEDAPHFSYSGFNGVQIGAVYALNTKWLRLEADLALVQNHFDLRYHNPDAPAYDYSVTSTMRTPRFGLQWGIRLWNRPTGAVYIGSGISWMETRFKEHIWTNRHLVSFHDPVLGHANAVTVFQTRLGYGASEVETEIPFYLAYYGQQVRLPFYIKLSLNYSLIPYNTKIISTLYDGTKSHDVLSKSTQTLHHQTIQCTVGFRLWQYQKGG